MVGYQPDVHKRCLSVTECVHMSFFSSFMYITPFIRPMLSRVKNRGERNRFTRGHVPLLGHYFRQYFHV